MNFNKHSILEGLHAPFSPSQSSWLRYDDDKAVEVYLNKKASEMGTRLHAWAKETIDLGIKQFFGTADAICFRNNVLRIHDLKTGKTGKIEDHMDQLEIYAALFCLEYKIKPGDIDMELRVYKNDEILVHNPTAEDILPIMDKIIHLDNILRNLENEEV